MASNYKRLGDYIEEVDERNSDLTISNLKGISIQKRFITSLANTIDVEFYNYKIVRNRLFAYSSVTSRNGDKITISIYEDIDPCIISQAYTVFRVKDENKLLPEYLMMYFRRKEFDRYARFHSYGSARETFSWEDMCNVLLPIPSIEEQREIVSDYEACKERLNIFEEEKKLLSEVAQLAFEKELESMPNCNKRLGDYIEEVDERNSDLAISNLKGISVYKYFVPTLANLIDVEFNNYKIVKPREFAYVSDTSRRGEKIALAFLQEDESCIISSIYTVFRVKNENKLLPEYLMMYFRRKEFDRYARFHSYGSARETFSWEDMCNVLLPIPNIKRQRAFIEKYNAIMGLINSAKEQENILKNTMEDISEKFFENLKR